MIEQEKILLRRIVIPNYPDKVQTAKARRPKYYLSEDSKLTGSRDIPKSFLNPDKFYFDDRGILYNRKTGQPQLANPQTAGKPRFWVVNFQDIWNQNVTKQDRAMKVDKLKAILKPYIEEIEPLNNVFPIVIRIDIYDTNMNVDVSNKGVVYTKVIEDLLVSEGKLPDDSAEYIEESGTCRFTKVEKEEDKRMVVSIYKYIV